MAKLTAAELILIPPGEERDKYYDYPYYAGLFDGEVSDYEIRHRKEDRELWGEDHLAVHRRCPYCGGRNTEWVRHQFSICFNCDVSFTAEESSEADPRRIDKEEEDFWRQFKD